MLMITTFLLRFFVIELNVNTTCPAFRLAPELISGLPGQLGAENVDLDASGRLKYLLVSYYRRPRAKRARFLRPVWRPKPGAQHPIRTTTSAWPNDWQLLILESVRHATWPRSAESIFSPLTSITCARSKLSTNNRILTTHSASEPICWTFAHHIWFYILTLFI